MHALRAHVENGRIELDEPSTLPNGTLVYVIPSGEIEQTGVMRGDTLASDGLADDELEELLQAIDESLADAEVGGLEALSKPMADLRG